VDSEHVQKHSRQWTSNEKFKLLKRWQFQEIRVDGQIKCLGHVKGNTKITGGACGKETIVELTKIRK
jgi:hypothetical protein